MGERYVLGYSGGGAGREGVTAAVAAYLCVCNGGATMLAPPLHRKAYGPEGTKPYCMQILLHRET
jgi:hypothetical protein